MTSNIRQKLALASSIGFPVVATLTTVTVLGWSNPAQAASFNFAWAGNDAYFVSGSFSYDDSLYSGTISQQQLNSFSISFIKGGKVEQQYLTLSSLFDFKFDTDSNTIESMDAGAFSSSSQNYEQAPIGSLSFILTPDRDSASGCDGLVWQKDGSTTSHSIGHCDGNSDVVVSPSEPDSQTVPEPASTMSLLAVGAFGIVFHLKRSKNVA
ncbi:MAG TPA: PEP-CTERM sorting domain-containing protein [Cyanophyceae cyanobacterium]